MKSKLISIVAAVGLAGVLVAPPAQAAAPATGSTAIDGYMREAMDGTGLPGVSIVVTKGDEVVHAAGYGHDGDGRPMTAKTPMRVASISKSFTAMAVMTLVDDGKISLDEPVVEQLPGFAMADPRADKITVRQLLNQTSGLSDTTVDIGDADQASSLAGYVSRLKSSLLAADPGSRYEYCNVNFEVAARLVEVAGGERFDRFMKHRVLDRLEMTGSAAGDRVIKPANGYNSMFGTWVARQELLGFGGAGGAGDMVTNATDMGKWLISQNGEGPQLVERDGLTAMHTPSEVSDYAMGWGLETPQDGPKRLVHSGNLFTYNAVQAIVPETGYGFAVMTNGAGLYDDVYDIMQGLIALSEGAAPAVPGGDRQLFELVLGLIALAAAGLGAWGVVRSGRWAARRSGRPAWRIAVRLTPALLPVAILAAYPDLISVLMNGRTVTWEQLTYYPIPLTITVVVAAMAGGATVLARLIRLRSVRSSA